MVQATLQACLIGAGSFGAHALAALRDLPAVELVGLSDRDTQVASSAAAQAGCPAYSDHRRVVVETNPEVVFLAVPPAPAAELVRLAARRGIHVWRQVPCARNLHEAIDLCRSMDRAGRKFAIGTQRRFMRAYQQARAMLPRLGQAYLVRAEYQFNLGPELGWRGDRSAGGGALLELGYHIFDLLVWLWGLPESVYALTGTGQRARGGEDLPVYDSDDTAATVLRFGGGLAAVVTVSRCFGPLAEAVRIHGQGGLLEVGPEECVLRDRDGNVVERLADGETPAEVFGRMIDAFARAAKQDAARYECSGWESLRTQAVVEAAYLSDQTGQPEDPADLLAGYDVSESDCLRYAPARRSSS
ncbi:MAG: hypothetical protein B1H04_03960 [Planctomycetales bacterium 4484_123]|nr:MAG: hypothetical protein B1H04_03960 [Planctomycetales bacterium 4484_123]